MQRLSRGQADLREGALQHVEGLRVRRDKGRHASRLDPTQDLVGQAPQRLLIGEERLCRNRFLREARIEPAQDLRDLPGDVPAHQGALKLLREPRRFVSQLRGGEEALEIPLAAR